VSQNRGGNNVVPRNIPLEKNIATSIGSIKIMTVVGIGREQIRGANNVGATHLIIGDEMGVERALWRQSTGPNHLWLNYNLNVE
jgi:hypothetical protein